MSLKKPTSLDIVIIFLVIFSLLILGYYYLWKYPNYTKLCKELGTEWHYESIGRYTHVCVNTNGEIRKIPHT